MTNEQLVEQFKEGIRVLLKDNKSYVATDANWKAHWDELLNAPVEQDCQQQWIPVGDRLPEKNDDYLVYQSRGEYSGGNRFSRRFVDGEWQDSKDWKYDPITNWMPLPAPPQSV